MVDIMTQEQYNADIKAAKERVKKNGWTLPVSKKQVNRQVEYAYILVRDKTGEYPDGRVLVDGRPYHSAPADSMHEKLLNRGQYARKDGRFTYEEYCRKLEKGYTPIEYDDVLEIGYVVFDKEGKRHIDSRIRFASLAPERYQADTKEQAEIQERHQRRKDIKLVCAVIKKKQRKAIDLSVNMFDAEQADNQSAFVIYAPREYDATGAQVVVLKNESVKEFMERNNLSALNMLGMGRFYQENGQTVVTKVIGHTPYKKAVEQMEAQLPTLIQNAQKNAESAGHISGSAVLQNIGQSR